MKIVIGCDPNAKPLKHEIIDELQSLGHEVDDFGADDPIYANVVIRVGEAVANGDYIRGIVLCGTGIGASITANKVKGIYCALVTDTYQARRASLSNNANMIALGSQVTGNMLARTIVGEWMSNFYKANERSTSKIRRIEEYSGGIRIQKSC
jgi:ribose 5-phosphate isomerase B